jgi:hypothetical protein
MSDQSPLFNTTTRQPETLPFDQIPNAIISGTHSYAANATVNVVDENGKAYQLPATQLKDALGQGFKLESPKQSAVREYVDENKGLGGMAKVALGKFADEALLGIPQVIAEHKMDPLATDKWEALKKEFGGATAAGSTAGFIGSLVYGGPLFEGASVAGRAAEKVAAGQLERLGMKVGSESAAKSIAAKMATSAVKIGTEGAVVAAPRALTEASLGDYNAAAESLIAGGLMGGVLGLGAGALSGPTSRVMKAFNKTIAEESPTASAALRAEEQATGPADQGIVSAASDMGASDETIESTIKNLKRQKKNAPEIMWASKQLNVPVLEGQVSDSKFIQDMHSSIINSGSPIGIAQAEKLATIQNGVRTGLEHALGEGSDLSAEQTGDMIKDHIYKWLDEQSDRFHDLYQNKIGDSTRAIDVAPEMVKQASAKITPGRVGKFVKGDIKKVVEDIQERFSRIETADDIKELRTQLAGELSPMADQATKSVYSSARQALNELRNESIIKAATEGAATKAEGEKIAQELRALIKDTDAQFKEHREMLGDLGRDAKLGKSRNQTTFEEKLDNTPSAKLVDKLFDKKNSKALDRLKQVSPEAYELLMKYKRAEILKRGMKDGQINSAQVIREVKEMSPEVRQHLLGDKAHMFEAARTVHESIMPNLNPSGTAKALAFREMLTPTGAIAAGMDAAKMQVVKASRAQGLLEAQKSMSLTAKALDKIPDAIEAMKKIGTEKGVVASGLAHALEHIGSDSPKQSKNEDIKKIKKKAEYFVSNPEALINEVANHTAIFAKTGAPQTANAMSQKLADTVGYIQSITPKPLVPQNPLMPQAEFKPSDAQMATFERQLAVILHPTSVIKDLGTGMLTHDQVQTLATVYPMIYKSMQNRVMSHLVNKRPQLPYQSRLKLSMLLGFNIDGSIQPAFVSSLQDNFLPVQAPPNSGAKMSFADQAQPETENSDELG